ncbi:MAG: WecB/TagA/CpsF family glycosyltransferase, partial [Anaerolineae bacterium]|nr:WecB/TagA/CpsF family glycosyltransferase [Anaerolineae bacterium]
MGAQPVGLNLTPPPALTLMGAPIHDVTTAEVVTLLAQWIADGEPRQLATINPEFLMRARRDAQFRATLQNVALCVPDGIGILWAARLRGRKLRERVAGSDLVPRLAADAARRSSQEIAAPSAPGGLGGET